MTYVPLHSTPRHCTACARRQRERRREHVDGIPQPNLPALARWPLWSVRQTTTLVAAVRAAA
eukprot:scaffold98985_cov72-Phaeocystis_antarctica.AAC.2